MSLFKKAFTLIELLVVISIIGVLAGIVLASLNDARSRGYIAREFAHYRQVQIAFEQYANEHGGAYPGVADTWYDSDCSDTYFGGDESPNIQTLLSGYISLPSDTTTGQCIWYAKAPATDPDVIGTWKYVLLLDSTEELNFGEGSGCYADFYCVGM